MARVRPQGKAREICGGCTRTAALSYPTVAFDAAQYHGNELHMVQWYAQHEMPVCPGAMWCGASAMQTYDESNLVMGIHSMPVAWYVQPWVSSSHVGMGSAVQKPMQNRLSPSTGGFYGPFSATESVAEASPQAEHASALQRSPSISHGSQTTLMVRNIPNKYTRKMLCREIEPYLSDQIDFLYLPMDFKTWCNLGYCFINFCTRDGAAAFLKAFDQRKWEKCHSDKVSAVGLARIQGFKHLVDHFSRSSILGKDTRMQPIIFDAGTGQLVALSKMHTGS
jgi:hypothetical protein